MCWCLHFLCPSSVLMLTSYSVIVWLVIKILTWHKSEGALGHELQFLKSFGQHYRQLTCVQVTNGSLQSSAMTDIRKQVADGYEEKSHSALNQLEWQTGSNQATFTTRKCQSLPVFSCVHAFMLAHHVVVCRECGGVSALLESDKTWISK